MTEANRPPDPSPYSVENPQPLDSGVPPDGPVAADSLAGPWTVAEGMGVVLLGFGVTLVTAALVSNGTLPQMDEGLRPFFVALIGVVPYALSLLVVLLLLSRHGYSLSEGLGFRKVHLGVAAGVAALVAVVGRGLTAYWTGMVVQLGFEPPESLDVTSWFPEDALGISLLLFLTVVVAPIAEEIMYRGMLFPALRSRLPRFAAIGVSGALFGLAHLNPVWMLVPMSLLGIALALAFEQTRSLHVPILAHALFNLTGVLMLLLLRAAGMV